MKRLVVSLMVLLVCLVCACAYADQEGLYTYQINDDNTVTITGFDWKNNHGDIYIPEMLGNRMVSAIGENAFATSGNTAVKITLPDNIRSIGAQAFRGASITYVNIPLNTLEIGGGAFAECSVMRFNVADGHSVFATIDNSLYNKQTKTLLAWPENKDISEIPKGIKNIGDYAFYGRKFSTSSKKTSYALPDSIETIGEYAFAKVTGVTLDAKNTVTINDHAFEEAELEIKSSKLSVIGDYAFYKADVSFTAQLSLSKIGKHAFEEAKVKFATAEKTNHNIISITPYEIEEYAFYGCTGNSNLVLTNVTSIGDHAFENTNTSYSNLSLWLFEEDFEQLTHLGENAFTYSCIYTVYTSGNRNDSHAYAYLTNNSLESIPANAFSKTAITDLKIGSSVTTIGESAFNQCPVLNHVELSDGLLTINDYAFFKCEELTAVSIPASVTMIGKDVFYGCADTFVVTVEAGSYGEVWARTCGYAYVVNGQTEDTSWLDD